MHWSVLSSAKKKKKEKKKRKKKVQCTLSQDSNAEENLGEVDSREAMAGIDNLGVMKCPLCTEHEVTSRNFIVGCPSHKSYHSGWQFSKMAAIVRLFTVHRVVLGPCWVSLNLGVQKGFCQGGE